MATKKATKPAVENGEAKVGLEKLEIPAMDLRRITLRLEGSTPLICHKWSEKAKAMIRSKHQHKAGTAKGARDPDQEAYDATYFLDDNNTRYAFPTSAFYGAVSDAALALGVKKSETRRAYQIESDGDLPGVGPVVELFCDSGKPVVREDTVRIGMGTASLAYRPQFTAWHVDLRIQFDANQISASQIVNLFRQAGFSSGIGEWRPSSPRKRGDYGHFDVAVPEQE